jgi:AraC family transcriptional regulator of adaptative response/methylated-DNA-[protein]-cysteine methyltransferase
LRSAASITDAIYDAGYSSSSRAYETSATRLGMTPSAFRRGGEGTEIGFTVTDTDLGKLLIAATAKGICSVRFGESEAELLRDLQSEFTAATLKRSDQKLQQLSSDVCGLLSGAFISRDIPLDIRGTAFQQQVWNALRSIPPGETRSYATIAQDIGKPKAVRAVANACAANPVAIVVPCHRVVQKNGSLAGYRWGVERKAALLKNEQRHRLVPSRT